MRKKLSLKTRLSGLFILTALLLFSSGLPLKAQVSRGTHTYGSVQAALSDNTETATTITLTANAGYDGTAAIPAGVTLEVPAAYTLTVSATFENNGEIHVWGTYVNSNNTSWTGSGTIVYEGTGAIGKVGTTTSIGTGGTITLGTATSKLTLKTSEYIVDGQVNVADDYTVSNKLTINVNSKLTVAATKTLTLDLAAKTDLSNAGELLVNGTLIDKNSKGWSGAGKITYAAGATGVNGTTTVIGGLSAPIYLATGTLELTTGSRDGYTLKGNATFNADYEFTNADVTVASNTLTIAAGKTLTLNNGTKFTIASGASYVDNGEIHVMSGATVVDVAPVGMGTSTGTIVYEVGSKGYLTNSDEYIGGTDARVNLTSGTITLKQNGVFTLDGTALIPAGKTFTVAAGQTPTINGTLTVKGTYEDLRTNPVLLPVTGKIIYEAGSKGILASGTYIGATNDAKINLTSGTITLEGSNTIDSGKMTLDTGATAEVPVGQTFELIGTQTATINGTLTVKGTYIDSRTNKAMAGTGSIVYVPDAKGYLGTEEYIGSTGKVNLTSGTITLKTGTSKYPGGLMTLDGTATANDIAFSKQLVTVATGLLTEAAGKTMKIADGTKLVIADQAAYVDNGTIDVLKGGTVQDVKPVGMGASTGKLIYHTGSFGLLGNKTYIGNDGSAVVNLTDGTIVLQKESGTDPSMILTATSKATVNTALTIADKQYVQLENTSELTTTGDITVDKGATFEDLNVPAPMRGTGKIIYIAGSTGKLASGTYIGDANALINLKTGSITLEKGGGTAESGKMTLDTNSTAEIPAGKTLPLQGTQAAIIEGTLTVNGTFTQGSTTKPVIDGSVLVSGIYNDVNNAGWAGTGTIVYDKNGIGQVAGVETLGPSGNIDVTDGTLTLTTAPDTYTLAGDASVLKDYTLNAAKLTVNSGKLTVDASKTLSFGDKTNFVINDGTLALNGNIDVQGGASYTDNRGAKAVIDEGTGSIIYHNGAMGNLGTTKYIGGSDAIVNLTAGTLSLKKETGTAPSMILNNGGAAEVTTPLTILKDQYVRLEKTSVLTTTGNITVKDGATFEDLNEPSVMTGTGKIIYEAGATGKLASGTYIGSATDATAKVQLVKGTIELQKADPMMNLTAGSEATVPVGQTFEIAAAQTPAINGTLTVLGTYKDWRTDTSFPGDGKIIYAVGGKGYLGDTEYIGGTDAIVNLTAGTIELQKKAPMMLLTAGSAATIPTGKELKLSSGQTAQLDATAVLTTNGILRVPNGAIFKDKNDPAPMSGAGTIIYEAGGKGYLGETEYIGTEDAKINLTKGEIDLTVAAPQMTLPSGSEATVTNKNLTITGNQTALLKAGSKLTTTGVLTVTSGSTLVDENAKMYGDGTIVFKAGANGNLGTYPGQKYIGGSDANINLTSGEIDLQAGTTGYPRGLMTLTKDSETNAAGAATIEQPMTFEKQLVTIDGALTVAKPTTVDDGSNFVLSGDATTLALNDNIEMKANATYTDNRANPIINSGTGKIIYNNGATGILNGETYIGTSNSAKVKLTDGQIWLQKDEPMMTLKSGAKATIPAGQTLTLNTTLKQSAVLENGSQLTTDGQLIVPKDTKLSDFNVPSAMAGTGKIIYEAGGQGFLGTPASPIEYIGTNNAIVNLSLGKIELQAKGNDPMMNLIAGSAALIAENKALVLESGQTAAINGLLTVNGTLRKKGDMKEVTVAENALDVIGTNAKLIVDYNGHTATFMPDGVTPTTGIISFPSAGATADSIAMPSTEPAIGMEAGKGIVWVDGDGNQYEPAYGSYAAEQAPVAADVTFTLKNVTYSMTVATTDKLADLKYAYLAEERGTLNFTITNTGTGKLQNLAAALTLLPDTFELSALSTNKLLPNATATATVKVKKFMGDANLVAGTYTSALSVKAKEPTEKDPTVSDEFSQVIMPRPLSEVTVDPIAPIEFTWDSIMPLVNIHINDVNPIPAEEYVLTYDNNINAGTATVHITAVDGSKKVSNATKTTFTITPAPLSKVEVSYIDEEYDYTRTQITPIPVLKFNGHRLVENTDFTKTYSDNINVGTGKINLVGIGNFMDTRVIDFSIEKWWQVEVPTVEFATLDPAPGFYRVKGNSSFVLTVTPAEGYSVKEVRAITDQGETIYPFKTNKFTILDVNCNTRIFVVVEKGGNTTAAENISKVNVWSKDGNVFVESPVSAKTYVVNTLGQVVKAITIPAGTTTISNLATGVYYIKIGTETKSIMVK